MLIIVLLVLIAVVVVRNIVIVPQAHAYVVERLGVYNDTLEPGLHIILPVVDRIE